MNRYETLLCVYLDIYLVCVFMCNEFGNEIF